MRRAEVRRVSENRRGAGGIRAGKRQMKATLVGRWPVSWRCRPKSCAKEPRGKGHAGSIGTCCCDSWLQGCRSIRTSGSWLHRWSQWHLSCTGHASRAPTPPLRPPCMSCPSSLGCWLDPGPWPAGCRILSMPEDGRKGMMQRQNST